MGAAFPSEVMRLFQQMEVMDRDINWPQRQRPQAERTQCCRTKHFEEVGMADFALCNKMFMLCALSQ